MQALVSEGDDATEPRANSGTPHNLPSCEAKRLGQQRTNIPARDNDARDVGAVQHMVSTRRIQELVNIAWASVYDQRRA